MGRECNVQHKILEYCKAAGLWAVKVHSDEVQGSGIPDILLCYKGFLVACETKAGTGRLRPSQVLHMRQIRESGGIAEQVNTFEQFKRILIRIDTGTTNG